MQEKSPPAPVKRHEFRCSLCAASAGVVELFVNSARHAVVRSSFTSRLEAPLSGSSFREIEKALALDDAAALYRSDREVASFYCPDCSASYCGAHWFRWDVFDEDGSHDSIRGRCPNGHERMLED